VAKLAVAVDQAERLFSEADPGVAAGFAALLLRLADSGLAFVLTVLRDNAYGAFQSRPPLLTLLERGDTLNLVPPDATELESIVLLPVAACDPPLRFEDGLAARLATDAAGGDALPLLQVALARLYEAQDRRGDGVLRAADYPGMAAAVTATADEAMQGLPDAALEALVGALVSDVTPDPEPVAAIVPLHRAAFVDGHPDRDRLLDAFIEARLLSASGDTVRPTHEALLRIWPRAVALVRELGPLLRARHMLEPMAREWDAAAEAEKPRHLDIAPATLSGALALRGRLDVMPVVAAFIAACEAAAEARRLRETRAQRRRIAALTGGLALALSLAGLAGWQWREAGRERDIAATERDKAEQALNSATDAANTMVFDLAQKFRTNGRIPVDVTRDILEQATKLQERLTAIGHPNAALRRSQAAALSEEVDTLLDQSLAQEALAAARQSRDIFQSLADAEPASSDYQRQLSVSLEKLGDVLVAQGNLAEALQSYRASRDIRERLAKSDPGNAGWQRDLSVSLNKLGDVLVAQGNLAEALQSYRADLAITERLAKSDPGNAGWQRDLSVSLDRVGDVLVAQGNLAEALQSYRTSRDIRERLTKSDPGNAGWQRDLSVSLDRLGNVLVAQGNLAEALQSYRASRDIRERLAKSDPGNAGWQRDLSVSLQKLGDVLVAQGDLAEALQSYRASHDIRERLAKSDPGNAGWQRDLSVSLDRLGDVLVAHGNLAEALQSYRASRDIRERLAKSDPGNAGWQRDLAVSYAKIANVSIKAGETAEARQALAAGRAVLLQLLAQHPDHPQWKQDLAWFDRTIASFGK
jgi:tetratricopeptide (TPR) repeat protein